MFKQRLIAELLGVYGRFTLLVGEYWTYQILIVRLGGTTKSKLGDGKLQVFIVRRTSQCISSLNQKLDFKNKLV